MKKDRVDKDTKQIFQDVQETQFLQQFRFQEKIIFLGEEEPLNYLKNYFQIANINSTNYYCSWQKKFEQELFLDCQDIKNYHAVIIVSLQNEHEIFEIVKNQFIELNLALPVLRLLTDLFVNHMSEQKLLQSSNYQIQLPSQSYAIVTTPRSGSNFLCSILESTQIAGHPKEHLRQASVTIATQCNFDYIRMLKILMTYQVTPNRVFGTKFISHFLKDFQQTQFEFEQIFKLISKFIYLVRRNKLSQAVSVILAQKTNVWHINNQHQQLDYQAQLQTIAIDDVLLENVDKIYKSLIHGENYLNQLFATYNVSPLLIEYEQLLVNREAQVEKILDYLELNSANRSIITLDSKFKKTSSDLSERIICKYKEKYRSS